MPIPAFDQQEPERSAPNGWHNTIQTIGVVVTAGAAIVAQFKNNEKAVWILAATSLLLAAGGLSSRVVTFIRRRRVRAARNKVARKQRGDLMRYAKRFVQFTSAQDPTNVRQIVFTFCGNNEERCGEICPPDYMNDVAPLFIENLDARPPVNARQFLIALEQLHGLVASYNKNYVLEPLKLMGAKRWAIPPVVNNALGISRPADPPIGPWLDSLPPSFREAAGPRIEDFRERWVGFLDDMKKWLERVGEELGQELPSYFERPPRL